MLKRQTARKARLPAMEKLEDRRLLAITVQGVPEWVELGPNRTFGGSVEGLDGSTPADESPSNDNPVSGAVQAIAVHPVDPNIAFIGTVNGGVWKTENLNAPISESGHPPVQWEPLTDAFASLSIGDIAISTLDPNLVYAGTGSFSSATAFGGPAVGVLRTDDGGRSWRILGSETFNLSANARDLDGDGLFDDVDGDGIVDGDDDGDNLIDEVDEDLRISAVVPSRFDSEVVLVGSTVDWNSDRPSGGLFRSSNRGEDFTKVSGDPGSGLPNGGVTDILAHPVIPQQAYAAVAPADVTLHNGIYRSTDDGETWQRIDHNLTDQLPPVGVVSEIVLIRRIVLAIHYNPQSSTTAMFAALVDDEGAFHSIWRSADFSTPNPLNVTWTQMEKPATIEFDSNGMATPTTVNAGKQGKIHFSLAADPVDPFVVWLGGDRQPGAGEGVVRPTSAGCEIGSGQILRGDANAVTGTQWQSMVCDNANGTNVHADSRDLVFSVDANGNSVLLEADDGGVYRLINPNGDRRWESLNGDLGVREFQSIGWDSENRHLIGGGIDNGTALLRHSLNPVQLAGDNIWDGVLSGDGQIVQVAYPPNGFDPFDSSKNADYYYAGQFFNIFARREVTSEMGQSVPSFTIGPVDLNVAGTNSRLNAVDTTIPFSPQYAMNEANPERMTLGTGFLWESFDKGDTLTQLVNWTPLHLDGIDNDQDGILDEVGEGEISALAYGLRSPPGGRQEDVLYVGTTSGDVFIRPPGNDDFFNLFLQNKQASTYQDSSRPQFKLPIMDIVLDDYDWRTAYVIDSLNVYKCTFDEANPPFSQFETACEVITGNLSDPRLEAIETITADVDIGGGFISQVTVLLVGGMGGVYQTSDISANSRWVEFGRNLPNAPVHDLVYDHYRDVLFAGTLGRGAWRARDLKVSQLPSYLGVGGIMTITGEDGPDIIALERDPHNPLLLRVTLNGERQSDYPISTLESILIFGGDGDDRLIIDNSIGPVNVHNIFFMGDAGDDQISINGGAYEPAEGTVVVPGESASDGPAAAFGGDGPELQFGDPNAPGVGSGGQFLRARGDSITFRAVPRESALEIIVDGAGGVRDTLNVTVEDVETLVDLHFADELTVFADDEDNLIRLDDGSELGDERLRLLIDPASGAIPALEFANKKHVIINAGLSSIDAGDTIELRTTETAARLESITINAGAGPDTIDVSQTVVPTIIQGDEGEDRITISSSPQDNASFVSEPLAVDGGGGPDTLIVDDTADTTADFGSLTSTRISGLDMAGVITYGDLETLDIRLGAGSDTFTVHGTHAQTTAIQTGRGLDRVNVRSISGPTTVDGGGENDTVTVGSVAPQLGGTLNSIKGLLVVRGGVSSDTLILDDSAEKFDSVGTISSNLFDPGGNVLGLGISERLQYSSTERIAVRLGSGDDVVDGARARIPLSLYGGPGRDVLEGGSQADLIDGGAGADILIGNAGNDRLFGGPDVDQIDGGSGTNSIQDDPAARGRQGVAVDGYFSDSAVFFDANFNGLVDFIDRNNNNFQDVNEVDEPFTLTQADGTYELFIPEEFDRSGNNELETTEGRIAVTGGADVATTLPLPIILAAPGDASVTTPLTTLIAALARQRQLSARDAAERIRSQLGISQRIELLSFDPIAESLNSNRDAVEVVRESAKLQDTVVQISRLMHGESGLSVMQTSEATWGAIAAQMSSSAGEFDLSRDSVIAAVVASVADALGIRFPASLGQGAALIIAEWNRFIDQISGDADDFLENVTKVQQAGQGSVADDLEAVAVGRLPLDEAVARNTGPSIIDQVDRAIVGNLVSSVITIDDATATESDSALSFTVRLSPRSAAPVSVYFRTVAGTASAVEGDYAETIGQLEFAAGETERRIRVPVRDDATPERDETLFVLLFSPTNAVIRDTQAQGTIQDNDVTIPFIRRTVRNTGDGRLDRWTSHSLTFSEEVSASLGLTDLSIRSATRGTEIDLGAAKLSWNAESLTADVDVSALTFPVDRYAVTVIADGVMDADGNQLDGDRDIVPGGDFVDEVVVTFGGDANLDLEVEFDDFLILAANFGREDRLLTFMDGDFDVDGKVQFSDFLTLANNFGKQRASIPPRAAAERIQFNSPDGSNDLSAADIDALFGQFESLDVRESS